MPPRYTLDGGQAKRGQGSRAREHSDVQIDQNVKPVFGNLTRDGLEISVGTRSKDVHRLTELVGDHIGDVSKVVTIELEPGAVCPLKPPDMVVGNSMVTAK